MSDAGASCRDAATEGDFASREYSGASSARAFAGISAAIVPLFRTRMVTTYEPGKTIVVRGEQGPVSFALGTAANIVNAAGQAVTAPLRAGQKVRVYYTGPTEHRTVERVIVED